MMTWNRSPSARFTIAVLIMLSTAALRFALAPWLGERAPFLFFAPAIVIIILWCGVGPAILASLLALGFGLAFIDPRHSSIGVWLDGSLFLATAGGAVALADMVNGLHRKIVEGERISLLRTHDAEELAEELNLLIDGAHGYAIYMLDKAGNVTIWNQGAERLLGWHESDVIGRHHSMFYPPSGVASGKPERDLARAAQDMRFTEEDWRVRKDGSDFLASIATTALFTEQGAVRGFAKIVSDITEQRAAEDMLKWRENHLRSILSTVPDAMVVIDETGMILSFSSAAEAMFGYAEADVVGRNVNMLMASPDGDRHDSYIQRYLKTGEKRIIGKDRVVFAMRRDGTPFPMELSIGEVSDGRQRIFTGFIRDLTERRRTEAQLQTLQSELVHVSRVSAMGTMASTLAHELNQPITAITNYVETVRDQLADPDPADFPRMREALNESAMEALRAGHIVRRLRDFVARGEVEKTIEQLSTLINEASVLGLMGARENGIEPVFDLAPHALCVLVDKIQIQQVLINLIRNACEAMSDSPERRLIIATKIDQPGFVRVTVSDTGSGIPPAIKDQLFSAFVGTKTKGMGLGLSICRTIVEANGGRIWMEPRAGCGTHFHFTLAKAEP